MGTGLLRPLHLSTPFRSSTYLRLFLAVIWQFQIDYGFANETNETLLAILSHFDT